MSKSITVSNLDVIYDDRGSEFKALEGVSFTVAAGEFVSIIGSSGCGKSTLLSVLEGLRAPDGGRVTIDGQKISGPGPERSVVFQQYSLFPWMTAQKNVAFAIEQVRKDLKRKDRLALADHYLEKVGLENFGHRYPKELSGGQQQRVAIARALAEDGDILLMDEPFGAIDAKNRAILQDLLLTLWEGKDSSQRKTVVFITHDIEEAILLSDRILVMQANPGRIRCDLKVPLPRPRHRLELMKSQEYFEFRSELSEIFFEDEYEEAISA